MMAVGLYVNAFPLLVSVLDAYYTLALRSHRLVVLMVEWYECCYTHREIKGLMRGGFGVL
jgi:hypothetical protein